MPKFIARYVWIRIQFHKICFIGINYWLKYGISVDAFSNYANDYSWLDNYSWLCSTDVVWNNQNGVYIVYWIKILKTVPRFSLFINPQSVTPPWARIRFDSLYSALIDDFFFSIGYLMKHGLYNSTG